MGSLSRLSAIAPVIGVTGRRLPAEVVYRTDTAALGGVELDAFFQPYARRLVDAGATVVFLSRESAPEVLVRILDGIVLAGGQDVDPVFYGGTVSTESTPLDRAQDEFDLALARAAIEIALPLLGTCRGHEILNVSLGGSLRDHGQPCHNVRDQPASCPTHPVRFGAGSLMHRLYGAHANVNSLHHQAVDRLAPGVDATAWSDDGVVEAIELPGRPVVGVQWHPELHADCDPILAWLVDAARKRALAADGAVTA